MGQAPGGRFVLHGRRELRLSSADGFLPVSTRTWLQVVGASTLHVVDTDTLIKQDLTWSSLEHFHRLVLDCIVSNLKQTRKAEVIHLKDKAELDQRVVGMRFLAWPLCWKSRAIWPRLRPYQHSWVRSEENRFLAWCRMTRC